MSKNELKRNERSKQYDTDYVNFINKFKKQIQIKMIENEMTFDDVAKSIGMTHNGLMFGMNFHREISVTTMLKICKLFDLKLTVK